MGRFNNQRVATRPPDGLEEAQPAVAFDQPQQAAVFDQFQPDETVAEAPLPPAPAQPTSSLQRFGFWILCIYLLSGYANDLTTHLFHAKAYLSTVTEVMLPFLLLVSGGPLRALRDRSGKLW